MADALMYQEEMFVLLAPGQEETILTPAELLDYLKTTLTDYPGDLPRDVAKFATVEAQATYLRDQSCELPLQPGQTLQWYAIRVEK
ncbi:MAG: chlororespiratory reduction protein 7 [Cyanobacteria bacterium]|nr:chlororespiratory reduction protein 7 [Cyanobacteriota bacterium]